MVGPLTRPVRVTKGTMGYKHHTLDQEEALRMLNQPSTTLAV